MATTVFKELTTKEFWLCVASEFFGCFFFVFIAAGSAIRMDPRNPPSVLLIALTTGLTVSTVVMATFHTSGGLVNPALTVGFVVARKISILRGVFYLAGQVVGGIVGAAALYGVVPDANRGNLGTPMHTSDVTAVGAFGCELVLTFLLMFVVFACTDPKRHHYGYEAALAIGVCVAIGNAMGIPISGGAINPTRAFGPAVVANVWFDHWIYWVGPIAGSLLASLSYNLVFRATKDRWENGDDSLPLKHLQGNERENLAPHDEEIGS